MNDEIDWQRVEDILLEVKTEFMKATRAHAPFHSAHEGWAVIYEEFTKELFDEIHKLRSFDDDSYGLYKEAVQVAAMSLRFIYDLCNKWSPP